MLKKLIFFGVVSALVVFSIVVSLSLLQVDLRDFVSRRINTTLSPQETQKQSISQQISFDSFTEFLKGASFGEETPLVIDKNGNLTTNGTVGTGDLSVSGIAYLEGLNLSSALKIAGVEIINSKGKIPGLTVDYLASLNGSALTGINAAHLEGRGAQSFLRSDEADEANAVITFNAVPGSANVGGGPLYINPGSTPGGGYTLLGVAVNGSERFRLDTDGNLNISGNITKTALTQGSVVFAGPSGSLTQDNSNFYWDNIGDRLGIGTTVPTARLHVSQNSDTDSFRVDDILEDTTPFLIDQSGNVGIGTTSPGALLDLESDVTPGGVLRLGNPNPSITTTDYSGKIEFYKGDISGGAGIISNIKARPTNAGQNFALDFDIGSSANLSTLLSLVWDGTNRNVGIGTSVPESKLQVTGGGLCVGSDVNCNTDNNTEGIVYSSATAMTVYDVAENYPTKDSSLVAGEVVELDPSMPVFVRRASGPSQRVLGVISTEPAVLLGGFNGRDFKGEVQKAVALSGRVPVKMDPNSPSILVGDFLTASTTPGKATKSDSSGYTLGRALEPWEPGNGKDSVVIFVENNISDTNTRLSSLETELLLLKGNQILGTTTQTPTLSTQTLTTFQDLVITGKLDIGTLKLDGLQNSLDAVGPLKIQPLALGDVEFLGGRLKMNKEGDIVLDIKGGLRLDTEGKERPECNEEIRGTQWFIQGGDNSKDSFEVCAKDETGSYQWRVLY